MNSFLKRLYSFAAMVTFGLCAVAAHAKVTEVNNAQQFEDLLKDNKRLAVIVIDATQIDQGQQSALDDLFDDFADVSNKEDYRLSKINFATANVDYLPQKAHKRLGSLDQPAILVLFEDGNLMIDDGPLLKETDLLDSDDEDEPRQEDDDQDDIEMLIDEAWGDYIDYQLRKRVRADLKRELEGQEKKELAAARERLGQQAQAAAEPAQVQEATQVIKKPVYYDIGYASYPYYGGYSYYGYPYYNRRFRRRSFRRGFGGFRRGGMRGGMRGGGRGRR